MSAAFIPWQSSAGLQEVSARAFLDAGPIGFAVAIAARRPGPMLWVQDRLSRLEWGCPYEIGLHAAFGLGAPILRVHAAHPRDALRAMEEGASCAALAGVIGELDGNAAALGMVATQRLALRAKESGVPVWLLRGTRSGGPSAARMRWRVAACPSGPHPHDPLAPGPAGWAVELVRALGCAPGLWEVAHEPGSADRIRLVPGSGHGSVEETARSPAA